MQSYRARQIELLSESDDRLVLAIRMGDQFAVKELFRRYYSGLCRFTFRLIHSREDVEDIVESVFEKLWLNRQTLDPEKSIKSFLFMATQNQAVDFLRHKENGNVAFSRRLNSGSENEIEVRSVSDPVQDLVVGELAAAVRIAIEKLPRKCKVVFTLNRQDGLSYSEIADVLKISERTVEHQIVRALKHMRTYLRDYTG